MTDTTDGSDKDRFFNATILNLTTYRLLVIILCVVMTFSGSTAGLATSHSHSSLSSAQDGISQQADQQLSIGYADGTFVSNTQSSGSTTEYLVVEITSGSITLGPQTDTEVRVQDDSTGETLTLTPTANSTEVTASANTDQDNDLLVIRRSGAAFGQFNVVPSGNTRESVTVEMAESGATQLLNTTRFGPFEVSIVGENGAVQAQTQPVPHGIRQPSLNGEFNSTAIAIERPSGFNSSWRVDLYPTVDAVRNETPAVSLDNEEDAEFLRGAVRLNSSDDVEINVLPPDTNPEASAATIVNYEPPLTLNLTRVEGPVGASTSSTQVDVNLSEIDGAGTEENPYILTNASELQAIEDDINATYRLGGDIVASETADWNDGAGFRPINRFNGTLNGNGYEISGLYINRSEGGSGLFTIVEQGGVVRQVHSRNTTIIGSNNVGGLVGGTNFGTVTNSSVSGEVTGTGTVVGGLMASNAGTISSVNTSGTVTGEFTVGGVVGDNQNRGTVRESYATATVTARNNNAGGLAGANGGTIEQSAAIGDVEADRTDGFNAGGLVGVNGKTDTDGSIAESYAAGAIQGSEFVGGLVGQNFNGTIEEAYAAGSVEGNSGVGGLVGRNDGSVANSYWDRETTAQSDSAGSATGLSTTEMTGSTARQNMNGLDFNSDWTTVVAGDLIPPTPKSDGYPILSSLNTSRQLEAQDSTAPNDPTQRVLQITGKSDPSELTQDDVTATITRFNRGQSVNNIDINQDDVTATITLFERN